jgi:hypothetical protein
MNARLAGLAVMLAALGACDRFGGTRIEMANPPHTRPGLWVETGTLTGKPTAPFPFCDPGRAIFPPRDAHCSQWRANRASDHSIVFDAVCTAFGATIRMHRRIVGDLSSAFTDDITSTSDAPGDQPLSAHHQLRYQGACPAGMKPLNPTAG